MSQNMICLESIFCDWRYVRYFGISAFFEYWWTKSNYSLFLWNVSDKIKFDSQFTQFVCFSFVSWGRLMVWRWSFLFLKERACSFDVTNANSASMNTSMGSSSLGEACSEANDHQSAFRKLAHLLIRTCLRTHRRSTEWAGSHVVCPYPVFSILTLPRRKFWETFPPKNTSSQRHTRATTLVHDICNGKQELDSSVVRRVYWPCHRIPN